MVPRRRLVWLAFLAGAGGCTGLLGVDLDYHAVGTGGGTAGGSTSSTTASTGGSSTTSTTSTASTSGTGGHGGVQTGTGGAGTGGDAGTSDAGDASISDASTSDASDASISDASTSDASTDAEVCDASMVVDASDAGSPCAEAGPNSGQIVATVIPIAGGVDHGALMAIAGGTPNRHVAGDPTLWPIEQAKTWYTVNDFIPFVVGTNSTYSVCVPPGDYTLQLWDRFGGGGSFDNGIPPNVTYPWEVGNSSRTVTVTAGGVVTVTATNTNLDVPDGGAFYGSWTTWDYGPCSCDSNCPSGTTCYQGACEDLAYDIRNCGTAGFACTFADCCNGTCVAVLTDNANCGGCAVACAATQTCTSGACQ
jgi:Stigma-specific protein, Stig1